MNHSPSEVLSTSADVVSMTGMSTSSPLAQPATLVVVLWASDVNDDNLRRALDPLFSLTDDISNDGGNPSDRDDDCAESRSPRGSPAKGGPAGDGGGTSASASSTGVRGLSLCSTRLARSASRQFFDFDRELKRRTRLSYNTLPGCPHPEKANSPLRGVTSSSST